MAGLLPWPARCPEDTNGAVPAFGRLPPGGTGQDMNGVATCQLTGDALNGNPAATGEGRVLVADDEQANRPTPRVLSR